MFYSENTLKTVRFGEFTFNDECGELRKQGRRVHLRPLALRALTLLLENAGSTVTREKLRDALWDRKVVEWETGLHRIAKELRRALGDDARKPRFIETVARRGYRFCASIDTVEIAGEIPGKVSRVRWFLAGIVALPSMVLTFCVVVAIAG